ncbi:MAG: hypothetical protein Q4C98_08540 [Capnocytophaga sp.]|nr:hypothetical protein [Capnocytophaga sp.]
MIKQAIDDLFSNLYKNTIIYNKLGYFFCQLLWYDYTDDILTIRFKITESVFNITRPRIMRLYEKRKREDYIELWKKTSYFEIFPRSKKLLGYSIYTDANLVKKLYELKAENKEEEMYKLFKNYESRRPIGMKEEEPIISEELLANILMKLKYVNN